MPLVMISPTLRNMIVLESVQARISGKANYDAPSATDLVTFANTLYEGLVALDVPFQQPVLPVEDDGEPMQLVLPLEEGVAPHED